MLEALGVEEVSIADRFKCSKQQYGVAKSFAKQKWRKPTEDLAQSMYVGVAIDESTDIGVNEQLSVVIKYVNTEYTPVTSYLSLVELEGSTAPDIAEATRKLLKSFGVFEKCVAVGADGASEMQGRHAGPIELLYAMPPKRLLLQTHCASHNSALCLPAAIHDNAFITGMEAVAAHVVAHSHRSAPACKKLKSFESGMGLSALKLKTTQEARWLSRFECLNALSKS